MSGHLPRPEPEPAFRARLRAGLMAEAPAALAGARRPAFAWLRPAVALASVALLVAAANSAAAGSLPGEPAFALRRGAEELGLLLQREPEERIETLATQAGQRLGDVMKASVRGDGATAEASGELAGTLERLATEVEHAKAAGRSPVRAEAIATQHEAAIASLLPAATGSARRALERAAEQVKKLRASPSPRTR